MLRWLGGTRAIKPPGYAVRYYANGFASSRAAVRGSFGFYRAWDATTKHNQDRKAKLTMPVLAIGGGTSSRNVPELVMKSVANDVQGLVIPGAARAWSSPAPPGPGHPRRRPLRCRGGPKQMIAALTEFLAPYRDRSPAR